MGKSPRELITIISCELLLNHMHDNLIKYKMKGVLNLG